jgi:hypothetical protein
MTSQKLVLFVDTAVRTSNPTSDDLITENMGKACSTHATDGIVGKHEGEDHNSRT